MAEASLELANQVSLLFELPAAAVYMSCSVGLVCVNIVQTPLNPVNQ